MNVRLYLIRLQLLLQRLTSALRRRRLSPVSSLSPELLEEALKEARMLRSRYGVEVRMLEKGEQPGAPKPAQSEPYSTDQP